MGFASLYPSYADDVRRAVAQKLGPATVNVKLRPYPSYYDSQPGGSRILQRGGEFECLVRQHRCVLLDACRRLERDARRNWATSADLRGAPESSAI